MGDESKVRLRDEVATLSETVRELRDEVSRLRAGQHGCGCAHVCAHVCTHPAWQPMWWQQPTIWCSDTFTTTNVTAAQPYTITC